MNLIEHIQKLANEQPERAAVLRCDMDGNVLETISRAALLQKIEHAAGYLSEQGLVVGDRVALATGSSIETLIFSWAAWCSGISTVPLDTKRDTEEMRDYKLTLSDATLVLDTMDIPQSGHKVMWLSDISHEALILFTSGTTAKPKGAKLTLQNLVINAEAIAQWLQITQDDRFLVQLPLHHINSTTFCLSVLLSGGSIAVVPQYSNSRFWQQAANSEATFTSVVPSIIFDQLSRTEEYQQVASQLKLTRIQLGSAPVVASAAAQFVERFHISLYQGYGQTETALRVTGVPVDLSPEVYMYMLHENSIGTPLSWATVEIQDETGKTLLEGEEGELVVKGKAVMQGYLAGEESFKDGWFLTGDIGYWKIIEHTKFFFLKGRKKEIIIKGGVNISPVAVENCLQKISFDIEQAFVIGAPSERYGEEVAAVIVWKPGMDASAAMRRLKIKLIAGVNELSAYETPQFFTTIDASQLPMTSTGKVQRTVLRSMLNGTLEPLQTIFATDEYRFVVITPHSPHADASHTLYNHCWQPLSFTKKEYEVHLGKYITLGAVDIHEVLQGQISFSYASDRITCVSICSVQFKPKLIPEVTTIPTLEEVGSYLQQGHDPVINFHHNLGAQLVEIIPHGRPEDKSSLGYTVLLSYPPSKTLLVAPSSPVSHQLITLVRILGEDLGATVFALSRPGGLATYFSRSA